MKLGSLFSDHAVLQREISVPVWGWTTPLAKVVVKVGPHTAQSRSSTDGKFVVRLPPMKAGGPYELEVTGETAAERVVCRDVWIGEVWLASGQSNMEFTFTNLGQEEGPDVQQCIPGVRMATVPRTAHAGQQSFVPVEWQLAGPETTPVFSAVAFHFARYLHQTLGVAVGIVNASWGGTIIEAWISRQTLLRNEQMSARVARYEADTHAPAFWDEEVRQQQPNPLPRDPGNTGLTSGWANADFDDTTWESMKVPSTWTSQGHKYSGIFWFRKTVEIPASWAGKDLVLSLGAADKQDITYFNGQQVGATGSGLDESHWNEMRSYRIPGRLVKAGKNVIASRVYSFYFDGGLIGPAMKMHLAPEGSVSEQIALPGEWKYAVEQNFGLITPPAAIPGPGNANSPYILFDNMIAPVVPYALRGAIWYQGESNAGQPHLYQRLMTDLVRDWRHVWGQGDFQFLLVQLANFATTGDNWPMLRDAQLKSLSEPNTGMAVAVDIGDSMNIHPANKSDVGKRLALWALAGSYGRNVAVSGPLYAGMSIEGSRIRLRFSHVYGGLVAKGGPLKTFTIAGDNQKFVPAEAAIEGDTVVVWSAAVSAPVAVRYAWDNDPAGCNLYNDADLPASPLRTDQWL